MRRWDVPQPQATAVVEVPGARIVVRRHGNPGGPRLVLSHGNGLAADLYYPFWSLLEDRFDLVLYDCRNHGWNATGDIRDHNIATFVADADAVGGVIDRDFGHKPRIGVFHSMSATVALSQDVPGRGFAALVLFDPPVYPPGVELTSSEAQWSRHAERARHRPDRFATVEELAESIRNAKPFARLLPGVADLLAATTVRAAADGNGYELCCPPEYESRIAEWAMAYLLEPDPDDFACPVQVVAADPGFHSPFGSVLDLSILPGIDYEFVPQASHFLQLEKPDECVARMIAFLEREGLA